MFNISKRVKKHLLKLKRRFIELLSAELSVKKVALTIAIGLAYGFIPFFLGTSIYLSLFTAWRLKLNHVLIQFVSNVIYPLQILMFVPFLKVGTFLFSSDKIEFSASFILAVFRENTWEGLKMFGQWNAYGLLLWLLLSIVFTPIVYYITRFLLLKLNLVPNAT